VMFAYAKAHFTQEALDLLADMEDGVLGVRPDERSYIAAIMACAARYRPQEAIGVHNSMVERGLMPTASTYSNLIRALSGVKEAEYVFKASDYVAEMLEKGLNPTAVAIVRLCHGFAFTNQYRQSLWWLEWMIKAEMKLDRNVFERLLKKLSTASPAFVDELVDRILYLMLRYGYSPSEESTRALQRRLGPERVVELRKSAKKVPLAELRKEIRGRGEEEPMRGTLSPEMAETAAQKIAKDLLWAESASEDEQPVFRAWKRGEASSSRGARGARAARLPPRAKPPPRNAPPRSKPAPAPAKRKPISTPP